MSNQDHIDGPTVVRETIQYLLHIQRQILEQRDAARAEVEWLRAERDRLVEGIREHHESGPHDRDCAPCPECERADYTLWALLDTSSRRPGT